MRIIEITESKVDRMSELAEEMLSAGGRLMNCISELSDEGGFGERRGDSDYRSMPPVRRRAGSEPMRMRDERWRDDYDGDGFGERRGRYRY